MCHVHTRISTFTILLPLQATQSPAFVFLHNNKIAITKLIVFVTFGVLQFTVNDQQNFNSSSGRVWAAGLSIKEHCISFVFSANALHIFWTYIHSCRWCMKEQFFSFCFPENYYRYRSGYVACGLILLREHTQPQNGLVKKYTCTHKVAKLPWVGLHVPITCRWYTWIKNSDV